MAEFASEAAGQWRHLAATYIRVPQDGANPAGGQAGQAMGRTCAGLTTKVTALVDTHGRAVTLALAAGPTADVVAGADVPLPAGKRVVADKGYASDAFRAEGRAAGSTPCIPPRKGRKRPSCYHRGW